MPEEQKRFHEATEGMLEAVMFENWLRFYFLCEEERPGEEEPGLRVVIPERAMERIRGLYGPLARLAEAVNGEEATLARSRDAVCDYIRTEMEGELIPAGSVASYFDTRAFQTALQLFNVWVQACEDFLDRQFLDFGQWRSNFQAWRASDQGRSVAAQIEGTGPVQA